MALISPPGNDTVDRFDADGKAVELNPGWRQFFVAVFNLLSGLTMSGTTAQRPPATASRWVGRPYFDTTLGLPIWWNGAAWVKADGSAA